MIEKSYNKSRKIFEVTFIIPADQLPTHTEVTTAAVVADFNNWSMAANPMEFVEGVGFRATIELAPNQRYEYRYFLNDVEWYNDWNADMYVPNRLQNADNCVVWIDGPKDVTKKAPAKVKKTSAKKAPAKPAKKAEKKPAKKAAKDDLTKVLGIGPKIAGLLDADGIGSFSALSKASIKKIQAVLDKAGKRYQIANPTTWPAQAKYAAADDWDGLKKFQATLDGGRPA